MKKFSQFLSESFKFLGQCDRLRKSCKGNEKNWQEMIALAKPVPKKEFMKRIDISSLLDDNETPEQFLNHPEIKYYKSIWDGKEVYFFEKHGFEFIFMKDDSINIY